MLRKTAICILFACIAASAQVALTGSRTVPKLLNYQGYLTDTLGIPIGDSLDMTFSIYNYKYFGSVLWTEDTFDVVAERGIFHALLGSVNPIPDSVFTGGTSRWLEVIVNGQTLSPRTQMTAMGYAYTATHADTAAYAFAGPGVTDDDWLRGGTNDTVLFTGNYLGIARGGADNKLYGSNVFTHTNFGIRCTTGVTHEDVRFATICGGEGNRVDSNYSSVVGGRQNIAQSQYSFIGGGRGNTTSAQYATVSGGEGNSALWKWSVVGGGYNNTANYPAAVVGGGDANTADGQRAVVAGGRNNYATGDYTAISGGDADTATGNYSVIAGGRLNKTTGSYATVGGGGYNNATNYATVAGGYNNGAAGGYSFIGSGWNNSANANYATVAGGYYNTADSEYTFVGGGNKNMVGGAYSAVCCGDSNNADSSTYGFIGGGRSNMIRESDATICGGASNTAVAQSFIGGGVQNYASDKSVVCGGVCDTAAAFYSAVLGGQINVIANSGSHSVIGGGQTNTIYGSYAVICGGAWNSSEADYSVIPGGQLNTIDTTGEYSMAFGHNVDVHDPYHVVFFDDTDAGHLMVNRDHLDGATGYPIRIGMSTDNGNGAYLSLGGVWTDAGSLMGRTHSEELDGDEILDEIESIKIALWTTAETGETHISPAADQFYQAFGCGSGVEEDDGAYIAALDVAGVSLRAVQELNRIIEAQQAQIEALEKRIEQLEGSRD